MNEWEEEDEDEDLQQDDARYGDDDEDVIDRIDRHWQMPSEMFDPSIVGPKYKYRSFYRNVHKWQRKKERMLRKRRKYRNNTDGDYDASSGCLQYESKQEMNDDNSINGDDLSLGYDRIPKKYRLTKKEMELLLDSQPQLDNNSNNNNNNNNNIDEESDGGHINAEDDDEEEDIDDAEDDDEEEGIYKTSSGCKDCEINACYVCDEAFSASGPHRIASLRCGHIFGHLCIEREIRRSGKCPVCDVEAKREDIRKIYLFTSTKSTKTGGNMYNNNNNNNNNKIEQDEQDEQDEEDEDDDDVEILNPDWAPNKITKRGRKRRRNMNNNNHQQPPSKRPKVAKHHYIDAMHGQYGPDIVHLEGAGFIYLSSMVEYCINREEMVDEIIDQNHTLGKVVKKMQGEQENLHSTIEQQKYRMETLQSKLERIGQIAKIFNK